jgi:HAD superfamily hydrolase (TIGR01484 family)
MTAGRTIRHFRALACDYDGTLATTGRVPAPVVDALNEFRRSGGELILVTGRTQADLHSVFPSFGTFSRLVLENGAVVFHPETGEVDELALPPPEEFVRRLRERGVAPLDAGRVIVASRKPHGEAIRDAIRELGLDLHLVFNRESIMVLPSTVTKATGLDAALKQLNLSWGEVVGVGDAENDQDFLKRCGRSVAVANALPGLKAAVDVVTRRPEGAGVIELVRALLSGDPAGFPEEIPS